MAQRQLMLLLPLLLLLGKSSTGHEYYSSTEEMAKLQTLDIKLRLKFAWYHWEVLQHLKTLNKVDDILKGLSVDSNSDLSDPITAYQLLHRLRVKFYTVLEYAQQSPLDDFLEYLSSVHEELPDEEEVDGVALGLLRLQEIYRLEPQSIMGFDPAGIEQASRLDPDECFHIAKVAYDNDKYQLACLWLREALGLLQQGVEAHIGERDVRLLLALSAFSLGDVDKAINIAEIVVNADPADVEALQQLLEYRRHRITEPWFFGTADLFTIPEPSNTSYQALCRSGRSRMTPHRQRALFCRYSTAGGNPRLMYAPVKEEDEWDHPRIVRYHDFLSEQETYMLKIMATPQLSRTGVGHGEVGNVSANHVFKGAAFSDANPSVALISQRIADITGLNMKAAEDLQVVNYGVGGHYDPHSDAYIDDAGEDGDRIATILIYLSDVEVGGATVFPEVGAALQPIKGSAVLWFNLLQNGEVDDRTQHSGCPVLRGNKWVANKWIRERGQEFRRQCSLNYWE